MKSMQITPLITFNLLDSHDNAEISMYDNEAQTGLSDQPTCILSHTYSITYVFSDWHNPMYQWRTQSIETNLDSHIKTHHNQYSITDGKEGTGKSWMRRGNCFTNICYNHSKLWLNFELETAMAVVKRYIDIYIICHQFWVMTSHELHCW